MINDIDEINVVIQDTDSVTVTEGTPTDIAEIIHNEEIRQENEAQRIANEEQRIANEEDREEYIADLKQRVLDGEFDGEDGFSPTANVLKSGDTATITITDKNGTTTAEISDGTDGVDGVSPAVSMEKQGKVTTLTITDATGAHTTEIRDGNDGSGTGDMLKATYDTNDNGVVDNAEKVNNHTVETDVPANAEFTDTKYPQTQLTFFISQSNPFVLDDYQPGTYFFKTPENSSEGSVVCFKATSTSPLHKQNDPDLTCSFADDYIFVQKKFSDALVGDIVASTKVGKWAQTLEGRAYSMDHFKATPTMLLIKASDSDVSIVFSDMYYNYSQLVLNGKANSFLRPQKYDNVVTYPGNYEFTNDSLIYKKYVDDLGNTKQNAITSTNKLNADLVDDTSSTNKFVTSSDISTWNAKSDFSGDYDDLTNKPTIPDELADLSDDSTHRVVTDTEKTTWSGKQDALVSGTNIKTINNTSILGSGDIEVGADIPQQDTAPSNPQEDDLWIDTDDNTNLINIDSTVSTTSTNPIENQAITNYVNNTIKWKLAGDVTGQTTITLPTTWNEILIVSSRANDVWKGLTCNIPYGAPTGMNYRLSYYGSSSDNANVGYYYGSSNDVKLSFYNVNGSPISDFSQIRTQVYYR